MNFLSSFSTELEKLVAKTLPAVTSVFHRSGTGSGVVLSPDGFILSNAHVVGNGKNISVGRERIAARLIGRDVMTDLSVIKVDLERYWTHLTLQPQEDLGVGQLVIAMGSPLSLEQSVSFGVVSAIDRQLPLGKGRSMEGLIQTDAAINPGNSGGPLIDVFGRVVGINTAIIPYAQGIGFAVPAKTARWIVSEIMRTGGVSRPRIGISARSELLPRSHIAQQRQQRALRIHNVQRRSPASMARLRRGDWILKANGQGTQSVDDIQRCFTLGRPSVVELTLLRGDKVMLREVHPVLREKVTQASET